MAPTLNARPEDSLLDLIGLMALQHKRSLDVVYDGQTIGRVFDRDVAAHAKPIGDDFVLPEDVTALAIMRPA